MEINSIQNFYRLQNSTNTGRAKKTAEESTYAPSETHGTDKINISSEASFKAELSTYAKVSSSQNAQNVSAERIEKLKEAYKGDNTPVSGRDIASAIIKYTFGTADQQ